MSGKLIKIEAVTERGVYWALQTLRQLEKKKGKKSLFAGCDFSGYSDMAIGLALLLGFRFPMNFNSPYKADSITDFWHRWHISLSTWLRDYLYISLGGNRKGKARTYINLCLTMLLGGLWHGASWNFVIWGGFHGMESFA